MAFAKFQENRFRIDGEIAENNAILLYLTASRPMIGLQISASSQTTTVTACSLRAVG